MKNVYLVFIGLWAVIQIIFTPIFLRAQVNGPTRKSLAAKMICATAFVAIGVLGAAYVGHAETFATYMLIGLTLSWFGDLFLHVLSDKKIWFVIGFCFFLSAHVFYIINYVKTQRSINPEAPIISLVELGIVIAALLVTGVIYVKVWHMNLKSPITAALALYGIALAFMAVKAVSFCISSFSVGMGVGGVLAATGAILFFISDFTIAPLIFGPEEVRKNYPLKCVNMWTYFIGQSILALSLMFVTI